MKKEYVLTGLKYKNLTKKCGNVFSKAIAAVEEDSITRQNRSKN